MGHFQIRRAGGDAMDRVVAKLNVVVTAVDFLAKAVISAAYAAFVSG